MAENVTVTGHPFPAGVSVGVYESFSGLDYGSQTRNTAPKNPLKSTVTVPDDLEIDLVLDVGPYFLAADYNGKLQGISFEPKVSGNVTVELVDPEANNESLAVAVAGQGIEVTLATDGSGDVTSDVDDVVALLNGDGDAHALVETSGEGSAVLEPGFTVANRDAPKGWQYVGFEVVAP